MAKLLFYEKIEHHNDMMLRKKESRMRMKSRDCYCDNCFYYLCLFWLYVVSWPEPCHKPLPPNYCCLDWRYDRIANSAKFFGPSHKMSTFHLCPWRWSPHVPSRCNHVRLKAEKWKSRVKKCDFFTKMKKKMAYCCSLLRHLNTS